MSPLRAILLLCGLVACGARSTLPADEGARRSPPGTGANPPVTTTGGGGAGGDGGTGGLGCDFVPYWPVSFNTLDGHVARKLRLVHTGEEEATLLVHATPDPPPIDSSESLTQITFAAWGDHLALGNDHSEILGDEVYLLGGSHTTVAPRTRETGISLFSAYATFATGPGVAAILDASTTQSSPPAQELTSLFGAPQYLTKRDRPENAFGFGIVDTRGPQAEAHIGIVREGLWNHDLVSCDDASLKMAGVRTSEAILAATTESCTTETRSLDLILYDGGGPLTRYTHSSHDVPVERLFLLPREDGDAWLVWLPQGDALHAQHIGADALAVGPVVELRDALEVEASNDLFTVEGFGNGLLFGYPIATGAEFALFDDSGEVMGEWGVGFGQSREPADRLSLLTNDEAGQILLAFTIADDPLDVPGDSMGYVSLIDCVPVP